MLKLGLGVAISIVFLYATLATVPISSVLNALAGAQPNWIVASLGFIFLAYVLKTYRWTLMLRMLGARITVAQAATPFVGGVAFNNVLPFRAGDVIRVIAFQRFTGVPPSGQLGTLLLERLLDLFVLMIFLFATVSFWRITAIDASVLAGARWAALAVALSILLFLAAPRPIRAVVAWADGRWPRLRGAGEALLRLSDALSSLSRPLFLLRVTLVSFLAWIAEGSAYFAVGQALGVAASPQAALLAVSVGTLSTIIPSSPGYVGTFHYFTARVATAFGATVVGAAAYAISIHALLWLTTTATGFLLLGLAGLKDRAQAPAIPLNDRPERHS
ncbi:MAG TPA: lysylphosphatidylglycerol synthase transmembrane domain-containing protein [Sphingomonadaceae bacterium]|nr:lysylphosphatidylglycerol synthase transmembrane domain-containing protein [Sphingomonadaceae bacterium]